MMPAKIIRNLSPYVVLLMTLALTVGTVFAQEEEASSSPSGLATLVLLMGLGAIVAVFFITWTQSQDDNESEQ